MANPNPERPAARTPRIDSVEALGKPRNVLRWDADAAVYHGEIGALIVGPPTHPHRALRQRVFQRIHQQIRKRRFNLVRGSVQAIAGLQIQQHLARPIRTDQRVAMQPFQHVRHVDGSRAASPSADSKRDNSSRSAMMAFMRCAWARMSLIGPSQAGSTDGSSAKVSRYPDITVSGVRSSCDALATKSFRMASRRICRVTSRTSNRDWPPPYGTICNAKNMSICTAGG